MKAAPWLDHLPPWLAWGAIAATGAYAPGEWALMALPLLAAALVQWRGWSTAGWRRGLELLAVAVFLLQILLRLGLLVSLVNLLCLLCGVRLCLPRELAQRRQLILMGFLLFISTAVSTADLDFLLWAIAWAALAAALFLQLNWEQASRLRQGPYQAAPHRLVLGWTVAALVLGSGFFVVLPRLRLGLSRLPASVQGLGGLQSGLSDVLDLAGRGPILANREVAVRILPAAPLAPEARQAFGAALGLLRGLALEGLDGQRWEVDPGTPRRRGVPGSTSQRWPSRPSRARPRSRPRAAPKAWRASGASGAAGRMRTATSRLARIGPRPARSSTSLSPDCSPPRPWTLAGSRLRPRRSRGRTTKKPEPSTSAATVQPSTSRWGAAW